MNIFILDKDPVLAAKYLCDKHIVKMITESFQMLSTVHHVLGTATSEMYRKTHVNHKCNVWLRSSKDNYEWLVKHVDAMSEEYSRRYNKEHYSYKLLFELLKNPPDKLSNVGLTDFALAMPDRYKKKDPVLSYRLYYVMEKAKFARWREPGVIPKWFIELYYTKARRLITKRVC